MPRLLTFVPCEKVIVGRDGGASFINILEGITITSIAAEGAPSTVKSEIPQVIPYRWAVFSQWLKETEDENKRYEQRIELITPKGETSFTHEFPFILEKRSHRNTIEIHNLPIGESGEHILKLLVREVGGKTWKEIATYPFRITIVRP